MVRVPLVGVSLLLHRLQPTMHDPPSPKRGGAPSNTPHRDAATPRKEGASRTAITQHDTRQQRCVQTENLLVSTVSLHVSLNGSDRERRQTTGNRPLDVSMSTRRKRARREAPGRLLEPAQSGDNQNEGPDSELLPALPATVLRLLRLVLDGSELYSADAVERLVDRSDLSIAQVWHLMGRLLEALQSDVWSTRQQAARALARLLRRVETGWHSTIH